MAKDTERYVLNEQFLNELLSMCMRKKDLVEVCIQHMKFQYIKSEPYKEIWSVIRNHYINNGDIPSYGIVYQSIQSSMGKKANTALSVLSEVKSTSIVDSDELLKKLDQFIRDAMSVDFFNEFGDRYNSGDRDGARDMLKKFSESLNSFSIIGNTRIVERIFQDFDERTHERAYNFEIGRSKKPKKIPFSIDGMDALSEGGMDVGDMFCGILRSGGGKTRLLRHVGVGAVRRGFNVLHLQAEGTKEKCLEGYDQTWTALLMSDISKGSISPEKYSELRRVVSHMKGLGSDIYVHAFEQFGGASVNDMRNIALELLKKLPAIDLILGDYLELFDPSDGIKYRPNDERHRRLSTANKMKNLCVEINTRLGTCTQANDIPVKLLDDPDYVMTRSNVSECKGLVNPFSFYFSGNQTRDEYNEGVMRIYLDKMRDYKADKLVKIYQNYDYNRFYDRRRTLQAIASE